MAVQQQVVVVVDLYSRADEILQAAVASAAAVAVVQREAPVVVGLVLANKAAGGGLRAKAKLNLHLI
jgi:hypothetical protein